jgi:hypothetical protein
MGIAAMTTEIIRCSVTELFAIERAARSHRQRNLLAGYVSWTRRDYPFLERLRDVRGLNVIEDHHGGGGTVHVTIYGSVTVDGFARRI